MSDGLSLQSSVFGQVPVQNRFILIEDIPLCFNSEIKTKYCKITIKTQQCVNISIFLCKHVSFLLDHLQASMQRYELYKCIACIVVHVHNSTKCGCLYGHRLLSL